MSISAAPGPESRHAFTLIELLVVIAIISLLVSILLPSLNRAKSLAKEVVCLSNVKQIGLAFAFYANDNADFMCGAAADGYATPGFEFQHWFNLLSSYAGRATTNDNAGYYAYPEIFSSCPEFKKTVGWEPGYGVVFDIRTEWDPDISKIYINYIPSTGAGASTGSITGRLPASRVDARFYRRSEFARPSQRGWLAESRNNWMVGGGLNDVYDPPNFLFPQWDSTVGYGKDPERHGDARSNILFADGHAKSMGSKVSGNCFWDTTKVTE